MRDTDSFFSEPMGVPTWEKCGSMCELCTVMCAREKCASARMQESTVAAQEDVGASSISPFDVIRASGR